MHPDASNAPTRRRDTGAGLGGGGGHTPASLLILDRQGATILFQIKKRHFFLEVGLEHLGGLLPGIGALAPLAPVGLHESRGG